MRPPLRLGLRLASLAVLAGCVPTFEQDLSNGDHVVTTYVRLQGLTEARDDNLFTAREKCHGGVVLIEETYGVDDNGAWVRLVYGCVARQSDLR